MRGRGCSGKNNPRPRAVGRRPGRLASLLSTLIAIAGGLPVFLPGAACAQWPAPAVIVAPATLRETASRVTYVGTVEAIQQVGLRARVEGFLEQVAFSEGAMVRKGDLLYRIERAAYDNALAQAKATLAANDAQVVAAQASLKDKESMLARKSTLARENYAAQATIDEATAERDIAAAAVEQAKAQADLARAQVGSAQLNLSYTSVSAPIDGRIGLTAVTEGNLVFPGTGVLATIMQISPIRVVFPIPERDYATLMKGLSGAGEDEAKDPDSYQPELRLPDGSTYLQPGRIEFVDNRADPSTGTVAVRAVFPNRDNVLLPGQYVTVNLRFGRQATALTVPQAAVQQDAQGAYVFVVGPDNRAQIRRIELGPATENSIAVKQGLVAGELLVTSGIQKVRPGEVVKPVATVAPAPGASAAQR